MARRPRSQEALDLELADLPPELRWREWMGRVATRYDKLLVNFMGFVKLAAIAIWLK